MSEKNIPPVVSYRIHQIRELEFSLTAQPDEFRDSFDKQEVGFAFSFSYDWDVEESLFRVFVEVDYKYGPDKKTILLHYAGDVTYYIKDLANFFQDKEQESALPRQFLAILTGIAISSIRGMITARTLGHSQNQIYLPILNPSEIVESHLAHLDKE